jgi:putative addiction module killer protein
MSLTKDVRATVVKRLDRIERGLLGDYKTLNDGIIEFRIDFGPGYRIYAGLSGVLVIMLGGSDKSEQERTISIAKSLWKEYKQGIS